VVYGLVILLFWRKEGEKHMSEDDKEEEFFEDKVEKELKTIKEQIEKLRQEIMKSPKEPVRIEELEKKLEELEKSMKQVKTKEEILKDQWGGW
jgi:DNA repair exonuclease SbcCD ATPase subunit